MDTEFERVNTYYPKLCLLQLSDSNNTVIIDPIEIENMAPLFDLLYRQSITKVLHSAHQDLEIFFNLQGHVPLPLYDTQIAAPELGFDKNIGYADLVKAALDIELDKNQTPTDWTRRPLSDAQLRYAANDVIYLGKVYELFLEKGAVLEEPQALAARFDVLAEADTYRPDPDRMWKKVYAAKRLRGRSQGQIKKLAAWRETTARKQNKPRQWIVSDQVLIELAKSMPADRHALAAIDGIGDKLIRRYANEWLAIIASN